MGMSSRFLASKLVMPVLVSKSVILAVIVYFISVILAIFISSWPYRSYISIGCKYQDWTIFQTMTSILIWIGWMVVKQKHS